MDSHEPDTASYIQKEVSENNLQASPVVEIAVDKEHQGAQVSLFCVHKSLVVVESEHDCESHGDGSPNDKSSEDCESPKSSNKSETSIEDEPESRSPNVPFIEESQNGAAIKDEEEVYLVPKVGMEFETEDHAYKCYSRYAVLEGFSIRKDFVNKSRINGDVVSRRYTCYRQGYRPTKHVTNVRKPRHETRTGCLAHMTIARQPNGKFRVTRFETQHNHEFVTASTAHILPSQKRLTFAAAVEADLAKSSEMDGVPKLGMGFDSEGHAYEFYNAYAGGVGFSVRKDYVNRSKIDGAVASRRFTCFREGFRQKDKRDLNVKRPRKETRIGCMAQLVISRQSDGKYRVTHFEEKHNHELVAACRVRTLRSQKRLATAQVEGNEVDGSTMQTKLVSELLCNKIGDQDVHRYQCSDYNNKLPFRRMRDMKEGEAERLQQYFQSKQLKNPSFFYSMQLDAEDRITNMFWADAKMMVDYSDFGDVVCLDTTYRLYKDCRPFMAFVGVNHHKQMVVFGAAFLYDETIESYKWLFQTFIEAMSGKKPQTILTDQDAVIAEAIYSMLPEMHHRICVWHMYQHALKQLNHLFVGSCSFINDLRSCFFEHEEDGPFMNAWNQMLDAYGLRENEWLHHMFKEREKWAIPYARQIFCADITTAQLHADLTASLKRYLKFDFDVLSFSKHLGKMLNDWHYKELEANYDMSRRLPRLMGDVILLKQARDIYTPKIFELFQQEYETSLNILINHWTESGSMFEYKASIYGQEQEYTVGFNSSKEMVACNCMKFEFMGVLCSHALKVLDFRNIKLLPSQYILKRWTRDARV
ncbi:hypothetical protein JCGZ_10194 [Jatropha curcas]|uniref:Protein FAR1-RELATED SEQUENCE n=1 Tax=Jatropha curcas TaxID=180498 RepID=A0A067LPB4_JATCU|nr:protein FAR1-RELATED SEQUENCE 5 [Jatropha curcas]KDP46354.1 hypothetical protein JCGZ_10194 [Jatropha curcas]